MKKILWILLLLCFLFLTSGCVRSVSEQATSEQPTEESTEPVCGDGVCDAEESACTEDCGECSVDTDCKDWYVCQDRECILDESVAREINEEVVCGDSFWLAQDESVLYTGTYSNGSSASDTGMIITFHNGHLSQPYDIQVGGSADFTIQEMLANGSIWESPLRLFYPAEPHTFNGNLFFTIKDVTLDSTGKALVNINLKLDCVTSCYDNDVRIKDQYLVKGTITLRDQSDELIGEYSDWCSSRSDTELTEYACYGDHDYFYPLINCENEYGSGWKCVDGACEG